MPGDYSMKGYFCEQSKLWNVLKYLLEIPCILMHLSYNEY